VKREESRGSCSYVASRTVEATLIGVGAISLLAVVTLRDWMPMGDPPPVAASP
jgi:hypothetical protein